MNLVRGRFSRIVVHVLSWLGVLIIGFPVIYALSVSFMTQQEFNSRALTPGWPLAVENYVTAFTSFPLLHYLVNSLIMAGLVTVAVLITSSMAAFAFTFIPFPGRSVVFAIVIATLMIPWEGTIIINFQTIRDIGWLNTYQGLSVPYFALAMGIFLLRQSFLTLPKELSEASQLDGASRLRFFISMVLPLSRPMLATLAVYSFITTWNKYLWPLLVSSNDKVRTVQIGLKMMQGEAMTEWPVVMAAAMMVIAPTVLVLIIGQRQLQRGLVAGSVKG